MTRAARWGVAVIGAWVLAAILAPALPLPDPAAQPDGLVLRTLPPGASAWEVQAPDGATRYAEEIRSEPDGTRSMRRAGSWVDLPAGSQVRERRFLLGTDLFGRDLLSRLVWGARVSLLAGGLAALVALVLGTAVGLTAGLAGGATDRTLMTITDGALAIPRLFLLVLLAALFRPSLPLAVVAIGATSWMAAARLVRGEVLALSGRPFVQAARSAGADPLRVAARHVLPAIAVLVAVEASLRFGQSVLLEGSLSFLGLGVPPPTPTWGGLIAEGRDRLLDAWWIATVPGIALAGVVVASQWIADGVRGDIVIRPREERP
jgi:peptide/nickel transport system permease protein